MVFFSPVLILNAMGRVLEIARYGLNIKKTKGSVPYPPGEGEGEEDGRRRGRKGLNVARAKPHRHYTHFGNWPHVSSGYSS